MSKSYVIGNNIKRMRTEQGYTQASLAKAMSDELGKVTEQFVSALERGDRKPGPKTMRRLCEALGVTEEEIRLDSASKIHQAYWEYIQTLTDDEALAEFLAVRNRTKEHKKAST